MGTQDFAVQRLRAWPGWEVARVTGPREPILEDWAERSPGPYLYYAVTTRCPAPCGLLWISSKRTPLDMLCLERGWVSWSFPCCS
jgi:hypothetical protein